MQQNTLCSFSLLPLSWDPVVWRQCLTCVTLIQRRTPLLHPLLFQCPIVKSNIWGLDCVCGERPIFVKCRTRIERLLITHRSIVQRNTHRAAMMPVILPNDTLAPQLPQSRIMITTRGNQVR